MVWRSQDPLLRRSVAVKLIHPRLAEDPGFAQALAREARRVAGLSERGIARLLDTGEQDGVIYLVREYAPGSSLRDRLDTAGPATPSEAVRIGVAALGALAEAHDRGVLHLALDLDDVIVGGDGRVCLIDFGIGAALASSRPGEATTLLGDEHLAPEQAAGADPDARTDVYAVASLLFELLTGEPPRGRTYARTVRPDVPRALDRVLARALDRDPERRFPDAAGFRGRGRPVRRRRRALVGRRSGRRRGPADGVAIGELLRRRARQARVRAPARSRRAARGPWAAVVDAASRVPVRPRGRRRPRRARRRGRERGHLDLPDPDLAARRGPVRARLDHVGRAGRRRHPRRGGRGAGGRPQHRRRGGWCLTRRPATKTSSAGTCREIEPPSLRWSNATNGGSTTWPSA